MSLNKDPYSPCFSRGDERVLRKPQITYGSLQWPDYGSQIQVTLTPMSITSHALPWLLAMTHPFPVPPSWGWSHMWDSISYFWTHLCHIIYTNKNEAIKWLGHDFFISSTDNASVVVGNVGSGCTQIEELPLTLTMKLVTNTLTSLHSIS